METYLARDWETPTKTSKCFSFRRHWERERAGVSWLPRLHCPSESWLLVLPSLLTQDPCTWRLGFCEYSCTACLPSPQPAAHKGLFLSSDACMIASEAIQCPRLQSGSLILTGHLHPTGEFLHTPSVVSTAFRAPSCPHTGQNAKSNLRTCCL